MEKMTKTELPTSFGIFSPTGHVVIVLASDVDAKAAREKLITGGFAVDSITRFDQNEILKQIEETEKTDIKILQLGQETEKVERYAAFAKEGCGFLVVYAPTDADSIRAMDLVRTFKPKFAEKYNRLTIQELA